jgi:hypothetical protein
VRQLDPEEVARRLVAGRERAERLKQQRSERTTSPELEHAMERARAALLLVLHDVEATTNLREASRIVRYDDWVLERALDPSSWVFEGMEDDDFGPEDLALACQFGGHTFLVDGGQNVADIAVDIAFQVQDDVTEEVWGAWPPCRGHLHPMSPRMAGSTAVWVCPDDSDVSVPIGALGGGEVSPPSEPSSSPPG